MSTPALALLAVSMVGCCRTPERDCQTLGCDHGSVCQFVVSGEKPTKRWVCVAVDVR